MSYSKGALSHLLSYTEWLEWDGFVSRRRWGFIALVILSHPQDSSREPLKTLDPSHPGLRTTLLTPWGLAPIISAAV